MGGGPGVEHMAEAGAGDPLEAGDPGLGQQLVAGDGVIDVGGDDQGPGEGQGHHASQVGGVLKDRIVEQAVHQGVVHLVAPGHDVGQDAASAHHGGEGGQVHPLLGQQAPDQGHPVVQLVVEGGEGGKVLIGVGDAPGKERPGAVIHRRLGAGGAGVQDKQPFRHKKRLLFGRITAETWRRR